MPSAQFLSLPGRTALLTGAASGIGAATAHALCAAGASVLALDMNGAALERQVSEVQARGGDAVAFAADVTDSAAVVRAVDAALRRWGRIDVLVNNAGIVRDATLEKVSDEDWDRSVDVNLRGAMVCARAVVPHMKAAGRGRILSASSVVARNGNYGQTAYSAA